MSQIKCGKCKGTHSTVAEVWSCYGCPGSTTEDEDEIRELLPCERNAQARSAVVDTATAKQVEFIVKLREERNMGTGPGDAATLTKKQASTVIEQLLTMPKLAQTSGPVVESPAVPAGYYAVEHDGVIKFYRVDCPTGTGLTFLSVQASDDFHSIRNAETRRDVLQLIAMDVSTATARYGQLIGRCGVCNRTLTDELSRSLGIGPVCRGRIG